MIYKKIIPVANRKNIRVITFNALKIGVKGFLNRLQDYIPLPILRIRKKFDFFTLMPRCIFDAKIQKFKCYFKYEKLVEKNPKFKNYFTINNNKFLRFLRFRFLQKNKKNRKFSKFLNFSKKLKNQNFFNKNCEIYEDYFSCELDVNKHKILWNTNLEDC
jgi:hypothetical protein